MKQQNVSQWAIGGGVLLVAFAVAKKFGLFDTDRREEPRLPPENEPPPVTIAPTITKQAARHLADTIFAAIYGSGDFTTGSTGEDEEAVIAALVQAQNDADVLAIMDAYGVRSGTWSWSGDLDLTGAVNTFLSRSDIEAINMNYRDKGIQILF